MELITPAQLIQAIEDYKKECEKTNIPKDDMETGIIDCLELCGIYFSR